MEPLMKTNRKKISFKQTEILLSYLESNEMMRDNKLSENFTKFDKRREWHQLAKRLNAVGPGTKTVDQWKKCWTDMKSYARHKASRIIMRELKTGSEPSDVERLSTHEERILNVIGWVSSSVKDTTIDASYAARLSIQMSKRYTRENLVSAIEEIRNGAKIRETERKYNIPHATMMDKLKEKTSLDARKGPSTVLTHNDMLEPTQDMLEPTPSTSQSSYEENSETQRSEQVDPPTMEQTTGMKRKRTPKRIMQQVEQQNKFLKDLLAVNERIAMACEISVMNNVPILQELKKQTKILERIEEKVSKNSKE